MSIEQSELEQLPPQGHVKVVYLGPTAPHWEVHGVFGDGRVIDEFRQRAVARRRRPLETSDRRMPLVQDKAGISRAPAQPRPGRTDPRRR